MQDVHATSSSTAAGARAADAVALTAQDVEHRLTAGECALLLGAFLALAASLVSFMAL